MTTEEAGFLRAICSEPEDDTPRLVYADWLEENGRSRQATFIREQIRCVGAASNLLFRSHLKYPDHSIEMPEGIIERWGYPCNFPPSSPAAMIDWPTWNFAARATEYVRLKSGAHATCVWRRGFPTEIHCGFRTFVKLMYARQRSVPLPITAARLTMPAVEGNLYYDTPNDFPPGKERLLLRARGCRETDLHATVDKFWYVGFSRAVQEHMAVRACLEENFPGIKFELIPRPR